MTGCVRGTLVSSGNQTTRILETPCSILEILEYWKTRDNVLMKCISKQDVEQDVTYLRTRQQDATWEKVGQHFYAGHKIVVSIYNSL